MGRLKINTPISIVLQDDLLLFYKNPLDILKKHQVDILFEAIGQSDGTSKKVVETALKNRVHVVTPNKALISKQT